MRPPLAVDKARNRGVIRSYSILRKSDRMFLRTKLLGVSPAEFRKL
jgi:hypothetical protein